MITKLLIKKYCVGDFPDGPWLGLHCWGHGFDPCMPLCAAKNKGQKKETIMQDEPLIINNGYL